MSRNVAMVGLASVCCLAVCIFLIALTQRQDDGAVLLQATPKSPQLQYVEAATALGNALKKADGIAALKHHNAVNTVAKDPMLAVANRFSHEAKYISHLEDVVTTTAAAEQRTFAHEAFVKQQEEQKLAFVEKEGSVAHEMYEDAVQKLRLEQAKAAAMLAASSKEHPAKAQKALKHATASPAVSPHELQNSLHSVAAKKGLVTPNKATTLYRRRYPVVVHEVPCHPPSVKDVNGKCIADPRREPKPRYCITHRYGGHCIKYREHLQVRIANYLHALREHYKYRYHTNRGTHRYQRNAYGRGQYRGNSHGHGHGHGHSHGHGHAHPSGRRQYPHGPRAGKLPHYLRKDNEDYREEDSHMLEPQRFPHADGADLGDNWISGFGDSTTGDGLAGDRFVSAADVHARAPATMSPFTGPADDLRPYRPSILKKPIAAMEKKGKVMGDEYVPLSHYAKVIQQNAKKEEEDRKDRMEHAGKAEGGLLWGRADDTVDPLGVNQGLSDDREKSDDAFGDHNLMYFNRGYTKEPVGDFVVRGWNGHQGIDAYSDEEAQRVFKQDGTLEHEKNHPKGHHISKPAS